MAKSDRWFSARVQSLVFLLKCNNSASIMSLCSFLNTSHTQSTAFRSDILFRLSDGIYQRKAFFYLWKMVFIYRNGLVSDAVLTHTLDTSLLMRAVRYASSVLASHL